MVSFFDDPGAQTQPPLIEEALISCQKFCALLWAKLKNEKTEIGQSVTFLGFLGHSRPNATGEGCPYDSRTRNPAFGISRLSSSLRTDGSHSPA